MDEQVEVCIASKVYPFSPRLKSYLGIYYHRVISRAYRVALDVPLQVAGNSNGFEDHQDSLLAHSRVATIGLVEHHSQHIFLVLGILIGIVIDV